MESTRQATWRTWADATQRDLLTPYKQDTPVGNFAAALAEGFASVVLHA